MRNVALHLLSALIEIFAASQPEVHRNGAVSVSRHVPQKNSKPLGQPPNCFPAIGFKMPDNVNTTSTSMSDWWCDYNTEYAFMGFSYEVTACELWLFLVRGVCSRINAGQNSDTLRREFKDIKVTFKGRYVRLYGFCDRPGF